jgi:betaine-homocysteine S-methyltransferase
LLGKEELLEDMNRNALRIAKGVAEEYGGLVAGDICNTNYYIPNDKEVARDVQKMFEEQVGWAVDEGCDFILGETFNTTGEALLATEVIKAAGKDAVINVVVHRDGMMMDGDTPAECMRKSCVS